MMAAAPSVVLNGRRLAVQSARGAGASARRRLGRRLARVRAAADVTDYIAMTCAGVTGGLVLRVVGPPLQIAAQQELRRRWPSLADAEAAPLSVDDLRLLQRISSILKQVGAEQQGGGSSGQLQQDERGAQESAQEE